MKNAVTSLEAEVTELDSVNLVETVASYLSRWHLLKGELNWQN